MPRGYRRKRVYRRRRRYGTRPTYGTRKAIKTLFRRTRKEIKIQDTSAIDTAVNASGDSYYVGAPAAQGDDYNERIGTMIKVKSIEVRGTIDYPYTDTDNILSLSFGVALIQDLDNRGENPSWTDVFQTQEPNSPLEFVNRKRFRVLRRMMMTVDKNTAQSQQFTFYRKLNHSVNYLGTGSTYTSAGKGAIFLILCGTTPEASGTEVTYSFYCRCRYQDY